MLLAYQIKFWFEHPNKDFIEKKKGLKEKLIEVTKKIDTIEEKHYVLEELNKESFEKFCARYSIEQEEIKEILDKLTPQISNLKKSFEKGLPFQPNSLEYGLLSWLVRKKSCNTAFSRWNNLFEER